MLAVGKYDQRLELIAARFALPEMPNTVPVQVLGPFRQEDCFPALGTVIEQPGLNDLTGTRGPELHGGILPTMLPPPTMRDGTATAAEVKQER